MAPQAAKGDGIITPGSFDLKVLNLYTSTGTIIDLRSVVVGVSINSSIYRQGISGSVTISESLGMDQQFAIHGNEHIEIKFSVPSLEQEPLEYFAAVTGVENRNMASQNKAQLYVLHFISLELYKSNQTKIRKTYKNMLLTDMIETVFDNYLAIHKNKTLNVFDKSISAHSVTVPNLSPYDTINWLSAQAQSGKYKRASNYYFFERPGEFILSSLDELAGSSPNQFYLYSAVNIDPTTSKNIADVYRSLTAFRVVRELQSYSDVRSGIYSGSRLSYDPVLRKSKITTFDYFDSYDDFVHLNGKNRAGNLPKLTNNNDLGKKINSYIQMAPKHYGAWGGGVSSTVTDEFALAHNSYKNQLGHNMGIKLQIEAHGDTRRKLGEVINIQIPSMAPVSDDKDVSHKYLSGNYLIVAISHNLTIGGVGKESVYITNMDIATDTFGEPFPDSQLSQPQS